MSAGMACSSLRGGVVSCVCQLGKMEVAAAVVVVLLYISLPLSLGTSLQLVLGVLQLQDNQQHLLCPGDIHGHVLLVLQQGDHLGRVPWQSPLTRATSYVCGTTKETSGQWQLQPPEARKAAV